MGFCIEERSRNKSGHKSERMDLEILAVGKRAGLSFAELNEFGVQELLDYVDAFTGGAKENKGRRMATQADIDKFYAS